MTESVEVHRRVMVFQGKFGPNKIFGEDVDERKQFSEEQAISRSCDCWFDGLARAVANGTLVRYEWVLGHLTEAQKRFANRSASHKEFRYKDLQFIVEFDDDGDVSQMWFVPTMDVNPRLLRVVFSTAEERKGFEELAHEIGWSSGEELGLELVQDFITKHRKMQ